MAIGAEAGLDAVGITTAEPFEATRVEIERRKQAGLADTMQFTFRNPPRSTDPARTMDTVERLVVGAIAYSHVGTIEPSPTNSAPARVADYATADYYGTLRAALGEIAAALARCGHRARVLADDNALVDRAAAYRAGLGWFGKNANLLLPGRGSRFVLGAVLTDALLAPRGDVCEDGCGPCRSCIGACPTDAIVEPGVVDAGRCLAWLVQRTGALPRQYRVALGERIYGCDECQTTCPVNRADSTDRSAPDPYIDAAALLELTDAELLETYGRWYIPAREARYLRRNALVVIGNVASPQDPAVEGVLRESLASRDDIVAAHAVWAVRRLGRDDLLAGLDCAGSALVAEELEAPVPVRIEPNHTASEP